MSYLLGDFSQLRDEYPIDRPEIKSAIIKNDLVKCSNSTDFHIFNLDDLTYFDPAENKWIGIHRET